MNRLLRQPVFKSMTRNGSIHLLGIIKREKLSKRGTSITLNRDIYNKKRTFSRFGTKLAQRIPQTFSLKMPLMNRIFFSIQGDKN